jgi:methionyl-tRNA formyltransferase
MNVLLLAYYSPGIHGLEHCFQLGITPDCIRLLTYDDPRNQTLIHFARAHGVATNFSSINSNEASIWIREFKPDIIFSLYYRDIVPSRILEIPKLGAVNLHPSLLPKYRGCFSVPWVIINNEYETGFTYHYMVPSVDAGNVLVQRRVTITPTDTAFSLYHKMILQSLNAFDELFQLVVREHNPGHVQTGEPSCYPRKVPFGGYVNPQWPRDMIDRYIRAMYFPPFKGALVKLADGTEQEVLSLTGYDALSARGLVASTVP